MNEAGTIPFALIETETIAPSFERGTPVPDALYELNPVQ
jgi:hypothetical protein